MLRSTRAPKLLWARASFIPGRPTFRCRVAVRPAGMLNRVRASSSALAACLLEATAGRVPERRRCPELRSTPRLPARRTTPARSRSPWRRPDRPAEQHGARAGRHRPFAGRCGGHARRRHRVIGGVVVRLVGCHGGALEQRPDPFGADADRNPTALRRRQGAHGAGHGRRASERGVATGGGRDQARASGHRDRDRHTRQAVGSLVRGRRCEGERGAHRDGVRRRRQRDRCVGGGLEGAEVTTGADRPGHPALVARAPARPANGHKLPPAPSAGLPRSSGIVAPVPPSAVRGPAWGPRSAACSEQA